MKTIKILTLLTLLLSANLLANAVATITALKGSASIERATQNINATLGAKLQEKDRVKTEGNSKVQIIFKDETIVTIGKNSNFSIEEYLFEDNKEPVARFNMIQGAMRTISGKIGKIAPQKFSVATKTATIGIRGTNFTILVEGDGTFQAYCTYGAISATVDGKVYIIKQGFFISISPNGEIQIKEFSAEDLKKMKDENFKANKKGKGPLSKDEKVDENGEQLDVTVTDDSGIIIKEIEDTNADNILNTTEDGLTDSSVIAGYSMNNAQYGGRYNSTYTEGALPTSGKALLEINFAEDSATLTFEDNTGSTAAQYNYGNVNSNTISGTQQGNVGTTDAKFYGDTGAIVKGTFSFGELSGTYPDETNGITAEGTYNVETNQPLN